jgi:chorismate mutase/prephenate dehydratase
MAIEQLRARIDAIDRKIVRLLNDRARAAMQIGAMKDRQKSPAFAPAREEQVLRNVSEATRQAGVLGPEAVRAIYAEVMSACRATERRLSVAFLGPRGTFSHHAARSVKWTSLTHRAARQRFGSAVELMPVSSIEAVFTEVAQGRADYGVAPIENTTEGGIGATLDMFMDSDVKVAAEILVRVHQSLLALPDTREVERIYSKAEVFGQCRVWLANRYPQARLIDAPSTSHAAEMASRAKGAAAIANEEAAEIYGLAVLHRAIEDNPFNMTRFYVLAKDSPAPSGRDKSSILCFIKDEPGALHHILTPFWRNEINLTKIESWPSKRKAWDYCFFIDFEGHAQDPHIARALEQVRRKCSQMKILGSFPASA